MWLLHVFLMSKILVHMLSIRYFPLLEMIMSTYTDV